MSPPPRSSTSDVPRVFRADETSLRTPVHDIQEHWRGSDGQTPV